MARRSEPFGGLGFALVLLGLVGCSGGIESTDIGTNVDTSRDTAEVADSGFEVAPDVETDSAAEVQSEFAADADPEVSPEVDTIEDAGEVVADADAAPASDVPDQCDCSLAVGFRGPTCATPVCSMVCANGGVCAAPETCNCVGTGYAGTTCAVAVCEPPCANGVCAAPNTCDCVGTGLGGPLCDRFVCAPVCANGGVCLDGNTCDCEGTSYGGERCDALICVPVCANDGVCKLSACVCEAAVPLALFTFEMSVPTSSGPHAVESGVVIGAVLRGAHGATSASYTNPIGNGSAESFSANNWAVGDRFEVALSTVGYAGLAVGWDQTRSNTGPSGFRLEWSANGTKFEVVTPYVVDAVSWSSSGSSSLASRFAPIRLPEAANDLDLLRIRLTATIAGGAADTSRLDNVVVSGNACDTGSACTMVCESGNCSQVPTCDCTGTGFGGAGCGTPD